MSIEKTQVEVPGSTEFLDAEATAYELVEALESLEVDVKGYKSAAAEMRSAATEMGSVAEATVRLTSGLADVGSRAAQALDVLVKIGGPEILAQLTTLADAQKGHSELIKEMQNLVRHNGSEMERVRASARAAADAGEQNRLAITKVGDKVDSSRETFETKLAEMAKDAGSSASELKDLGDKLTELVSDTKTAVAEHTALLGELSMVVSDHEQRRATEQNRTHTVALWSAGLAAVAALMSGIVLMQSLG